MFHPQKYATNLIRCMMNDPAVCNVGSFCRRRPCMGWTRNPGTARLLGVLNAVCWCEGLRTSRGQDGQVTSFGRLQCGHDHRVCDCEWQQLEAAAILVERPEKVESWPSPRLQENTATTQSNNLKLLRASFLLPTKVGMSPGTI